MKRIPLGKKKNRKNAGLCALIDDEDVEIILPYKWCIKTGHTKHHGQYHYARSVASGRKTILMHRLIMGVTDPKITVDHINGNGLDNRRCNLRIATRSEQLTNRRTWNKTGYRGIKFDKAKGVYIASYQIGRYETAEEASAAYEKVYKAIVGEDLRDGIIYNGKDHDPELELYEEAYSESAPQLKLFIH